MTKIFAWIIASSLLLVQSKQNINFDADLASPLNVPLILAASFGEVRPNHFHTGIDIKTQGQENLPIFSVADGYVSRIHISPYGYGNAVYVNHPKLGLTSVYAHCNSFAPAIDSLLKQYQNENKCNEVEFYLNPFQFVVKKGEHIAFSGNTGSSEGPHLHFELRDLLTEHPYNPLLFTAFKSIQDHTKPNIRHIKLYALSKDGVPIPGFSSSRKVRKSNENFSISDGVWTISSSFCSKEGGIGFSVDAVDYMDDSYNQCGIYESALLVNDDTVFQQNMSELDFETQRYINAHVDLYEYWQFRRKLQNQFKTPFNQLPIYSNNKNGIMHFVPDSSYRIHYYCKDAKGNISTISFLLNIAAGNVRTEKEGIDTYSANFWYPDSSYQYSNEFCAVSLPKDVFFAPTQKNIQFNDHSITVGEEGIALNQKYTLCWKIDSTKFIPKTVIALKTANGKLKALESIYDGYELYASTNRFGTFLLSVDTIPPDIYPKGFYDSAQVSVSTKLRWRVSDDFSGIGAYNLYVNGNWTPIEYDYKNNDIILKLSLQEGWYSFSLYVEDKLGNTKTCSTHLQVISKL